MNFGAKLVTDKSKFNKFKELGLQPSLTKEEAMEQAAVIIDCTPKKYWKPK